MSAKVEPINVVSRRIRELDHSLRTAFGPEKKYAALFEIMVAIETGYRDESIKQTAIDFYHSKCHDMYELDVERIEHVIGDARTEGRKRAQQPKAEEPSRSKTPPKPSWRERLIDVQELCDKRFSELKYVVPGLFPEGVTLLASRPKMGKSWLLLQITTSVANGTITLAPCNSPPCGDVLYLALEDNPRRLQRRLTKYFGPIREAWPKRLTVVTGWSRLDKGGLQELREWCESVEKPLLIAIDTLKKVRAPKRSGQTDYDADYEACEGLQKLAGDFGISILIAHHDRKMGAEDVFDTVSGTLGLTGGVDTIAVMKRKSGAVTLHIEGRDLEDSIEKAIAFDRETGRWLILGEAEEVLRSNQRSRILALLADAPDGMKSNEIVAALGVKDRHPIDILLSRMVDDGLIMRIKRGLYGPLGARTNPSERKRENDR